MRNQNYSNIENMMLNIHEEGEEQILDHIESICDAISRYKERNTYYFALDKMKGK